MAELVSYLSIEPHMRTFDVFTAKHSAPLTRGFFCAARALSVTPTPHDTPIVVGVCPICDSGAPDFIKQPRAAAPTGQDQHDAEPAGSPVNPEVGTGGDVGLDVGDRLRGGLNRFPPYSASPRRPLGPALSVQLHAVL
jgi:hypothetical protein